MSTAENEHTYQPDSQMLIIMVGLVNKLKRECYFCDLILLIYTTVAYNKNADDLRQFAYWEAGVILFLGFLQYFLIANKGIFITKTVIEIAIVNNHYIIKTAAFHGPFWFRKEAADYKFSIAQTKIKLIPNTYTDIYKESKQLIRLVNKGKDVYVMPEYFNWQLEEDLLPAKPQA